MLTLRLDSGSRYRVVYRHGYRCIRRARGWRVINPLGRLVALNVSCWQVRAIISAGAPRTSR